VALTAAAAAAAVPDEPALPPPDAISQPLYQTAGCLDPITATTPEECVFGDTTSPVLTIALVGDSAAGEWFDALKVVGNVLVYSDRHHLTSYYSKSTAPLLASLLLKANPAFAIASPPA
jgi:hypothetical protein